MLDVLRASPLLADLPEATLDRLATVSEQLSLEAGEVLLTEGDEPDAMYVVVEGEVEITKRIEGTDLLLATSGPGEMVGELSLIQRRPRSATARASTPVRVLRIDVETLDELLTNPHVAMVLLSTVSGRLQELELQLRQGEKMRQLGTLSAGLLHELNNPAAAVRRAVERLDEVLREWQEVDARLEDRAVLARLAELLTSTSPPMSALARLDAEEELATTLRELGVEEADSLAPALTELGIAGAQLRDLLREVPGAECQGALRWLALRGRMARLVSEAGTGAERISEVVAAVKRYSHVDEASLQDVDVHAGLEAALTILGGKVGSGVEVVRDYDESLPLIEGYPGDLNTVWTNLLDNALDAIGERGTLTVRTCTVEDGVAVEVVNTGPPVPQEVLARVFDPFFTTKPIGKGTGLGLATSHFVVVKRHRGRLTLTSEPDHTVATVVLPTSPADERPVAPGPVHDR